MLAYRKKLPYKIVRREKDFTLHNLSCNGSTKRIELTGEECHDIMDSDITDYEEEKIRAQKKGDSLI